MTDPKTRENKFPPPPIQEPIYDRNNNMSRNWALWFTLIYEYIQKDDKVGNLELEV